MSRRYILLAPKNSCITFSLVLIHHSLFCTNVFVIACTKAMALIFYRALTNPPPFSGNPLGLNTFKIKLTHFLRGNFNTYFDNRSQVMCAGALLSGPAAQWYETLLDPQTKEEEALSLQSGQFFGRVDGIFRGRDDHGFPRTLPRRSASNRICVSPRHCILEHHQYLCASME